jgi:hypothetical protein
MSEDAKDTIIEQFPEGQPLPEEPADNPQAAEKQPVEEPEQQEPDTEEAKTEAAIEQFKDAIIEQAREDERPMSSSFSLRKILGGDWLTAELLRKQLGVLLLIVAFVIIYIANRYSCQKDMLEIDRLNSELIDAKYRALSSSSELTEKCRESNVLKMLKNNKDSLLRIPNQPPYIIEVPE